MISVVCVFNDAEHLERRLLNSLRRQTAQHEVVTIDNRDNRFANAASALNSGSAQARGDWVLFAHQDVELLSSDWLRKAEDTLQSLSDVGWVGVAGRASDGAHRGFLRNGAALQGLPFERAVEVQTLDELLLIHRRESRESKYFDEQVPGWHAYGVESCCRASRQGAKNYVLSLPVWHDTPGTNLAGLDEAHQYVWRKHGAEMGRIHTTCGVLQGSTQQSAGFAAGQLARAVRRISNLRFHFYGFPSSSVTWFHETLDSLTQTSNLVHCLHDYANQDPIEAEGFGTNPTRCHRIVHSFSGFEAADLGDADVVTAPDLSARLSDNTVALEQLRKGVQRLLVCVRIEQIRAQRQFGRWLGKRAAGRYLTLDKDGRRIAVVEMSRG